MHLTTMPAALLQENMTTEWNSAKSCGNSWYKISVLDKAEVTIF